jgi:lipoprotein-anchoring transpeptidase ErfK/SrfK
MTTSTARPVARRRVAASLAALLVPVLLAACQQAQADQGAADPAPSPSATASAAPAPEATVAVSPAAGTADVRPDTPVVLTAEGGRLGDVAVTADDGSVLAGETAPDGRSWTSTGGLVPGSTYAVSGVAINPDAVRTPVQSSFSTLVPSDVETASVQPKTGWVVGVGMPVVVHFDAEVTDRAAVERRLLVTASPAVEGAWHWVDDTQVQYRPREFWTTGTTVTVDADLSGIEFAGGIWGVRAEPTTFSVGSAMVSTVDIAAHTLTVTRDGEVLRTIPITTGKDGFETRNGTKVVISRESNHRMDAASTGIEPGDPEYYNLDVEYAMRLTWSGEFFHAAPWSVGSQGRANVSHGCTGMSTADARWLMESSKVGDVAQFVGGDRELEKDNGWTAWNMTFEEWQAGSALVG